MANATIWGLHDDGIVAIAHVGGVALGGSTEWPALIENVLALTRADSQAPAAYIDLEQHVVSFELEGHEEATDVVRIYPAQDDRPLELKVCNPEFALSGGSSGSGRVLRVCSGTRWVAFANLKRFSVTIEAIAPA